MNDKENARKIDLFVRRNEKKNKKIVEKSGELWRKVYTFVTEFKDLCIHMRFLGNIEAKIDAKGRVFLPAVFRKTLQTAGEESLVLRKDVFQQCLTLYPQSVWNEQMDMLRDNLNRWNKQHQELFRQFVSDVELVTLDGNGRFLIPKRYLAMAGISREVKFIGMGDTMEVWSAEATSKPFVEPEEFGRQLEEIMKTERMKD